MSTAITNSLVKTQIQMNFASPSGLNIDVLGTESTIGLSGFNLRAANIISDIQHDIDPATGLTYSLYTRRLNDIRKRLGTTPNFLTSFDGGVRPNMPIGLGAGFVQFVNQQGAGALAAQNYLITTLQPLAV